MRTRRTRTRRIPAVAAVGVAVALAAGLLPGCASGSGHDRVRVLAAASLTEAFQRIADAFEAAHDDVDVELSFAGTQVLVRQLDRGAPADVFASADVESMDTVVGLGAVAGDPQVFATNALEIVVEPGNPKRIRGLADLARAELVVALAAENVPAGRYARVALRRAGVQASVDTLEPSVKAIVAKVGLGEVDAGIVYRTDVTAAAGRVGGVAIPAGQNVRAVLPIAVLEDAGPTARRFVEFVLSAAGRRILRQAGFGPPED